MFQRGFIINDNWTRLRIHKLPGHVSAIMRALTSTDGDLLSHFDNVNDSEISNNSLNFILIDNHDQTVNRGKNTGQLPLEDTFGFCRTFKKFTKKISVFNSRSKQMIYKKLYTPH